MKSSFAPVALVLGLGVLAGGVGCSASTGGSDGPIPGQSAGSPGASQPGASSSAGNDAGTVVAVTPPSSAGSGASGADAGTSAPDAATEGSNDASAPQPDGGAAAATTELAPYFPTWTWGTSGYAYASLVDLAKKTGLKEVTIAFVLSGGGCTADQGIEQNLDDVKAFVAGGGHVKASFGGADGTYVESQCQDAASYAKALTDFVDATGIVDLDFDVEQGPVMTDAVNDLRGKGLALAQAARGIKVAFTLPANPHSSGSPGGLTPEGQSVVGKAVAAGVTILHVNMMTMDYGDSFGGQPLAPVAIGSLDDAHTQIMSLVPGITSAAAWQMVGVIPMIGKNDDAEVFSLDDAKAVAAFAKQKGVGLVSFWSIDRDRVCPGAPDFNSCSTVNAADFDFTKALGGAL